MMNRIKLSLFFRDFELLHSDIDNESGFLNIVQQELSIWLMTRMEVFCNYSIYKYIRMFLENKGIVMPDFVLGTNLLMLQVVEALWPEQEYENDKKVALERWNAHQDGRVGNLQGIGPQSDSS